MVKTLLLNGPLPLMEVHLFMAISYKFLQVTTLHLPQIRLTVMVMIQLLFQAQLAPFQLQL